MARVGESGGKKTKSWSKGLQWAKIGWWLARVHTKKKKHVLQVRHKGEREEDQKGKGGRRFSNATSPEGSNCGTTN